MPSFTFQRQQCLQKEAKPSFTFRRRKCLQSFHASKRRQCHPLHFKDDNVFSHFMLSKVDNAFIYISNNVFKRRQCLHLHFEDDNVFKRRQCLHLHFEDEIFFSHFMLPKGDNAFIYISKTTMSLVISCFQKSTMPLFIFRRQQYLQSFHAFKRRQCLHLHFRR